MKESERLRKKAQETDNDLSALGVYTKVLRAERNERWEDNWLEIFQKHFTVTINKNGSYCILVEEGKMDYYPRSNRLLLRWENDWKSAGLRWMIKHYLDKVKPTT